GRSRHTRFSRDWSSDVCSSDLARPVLSWRRSDFPAAGSRRSALVAGACLDVEPVVLLGRKREERLTKRALDRTQRLLARLFFLQIGRASCRERGEIGVGAASVN